MIDIVQTLKKLGPCRSSKLAQYLQEKEGISDATARQRIVRNKSIQKFPIRLLPNREDFIYLKNQRNSENFLLKLYDALKETKTVYGMTIDSLSIRGGIVKTSEFSVISGAPVALKKQVTASIVAKNLEKASVIKKHTFEGTDYYSLQPPFVSKSMAQYQSLLVAEQVLLDGIKNWVKQLGLASYNKIQIRGDASSRKVGQFVWDLTGPSYLLPLKTHLSNQTNPGFLVIDVFGKSTLSADSIKYFVRKVQLLQASIRNIKLLPILVGEDFDSSALRYGKENGIILASIKNLFGRQVAEGISTFIEILNNAAPIAIKNPNKLIETLKKLSQMEVGAIGNLKGTFFELISLHLAKKGAESVDHSVKVIDQNTNKIITDIDVFRIVHKTEVVCIECKGKKSSAYIEIHDVTKWLSLLPKFRDHIKNQKRFKNCSISFELWTTGTFSEDAIKKLQNYKNKKQTIKWKDGKDILNMARTLQEKGIVDALKEHYFK